MPIMTQETEWATDSSDLYSEGVWLEQQRLND
jgi:hypothetical protein